MSVPVRRTARLLMRGFTGADRETFAAMNADPVVMEHFQSTMTREATDGFVDRIDACWADRGWGLWAIEVLPWEGAPDGVPFIGYVGMWPAEHIPGHPTAEVGWRLAHEHWGRGYAPKQRSRRCDTPSTRSASPRWCRSHRSTTSTRGE